MKRKIALLVAVILCLSLAACSKVPEPEQVPQETSPEAIETEDSGEMQQDNSAQRGSTTKKPEETAQQSIELAGPWHLDHEKIDPAVLSDRFPGYAEWGDSMEIRSSGEMSWYIGAEGWHGTYEVEDEILHAELDSELEARTQSWDFRIVIENESATLEMEYEDLTLCWVYGEQEEAADGSGGA